MTTKHGGEILDVVKSRVIHQLVTLLSNTPAIDVNEQDSEGNTALMVAAHNNDIDILQTLLAKRADTTIKNNVGQTALGVAEEHGSRASYNVLNSHKALKSINYPFINYFSHVPLNRQAHKRKDTEWLSKMKIDPTSKYIIFSNLNPLAAKLENEKKYRLSVLSYPQIKDILGDDIIHIDNEVFLGSEESLHNKGTSMDQHEVIVPWFAIDIGQITNAPEKFLANFPEAEYLSPRPGYLQVHVEDATILAQARPILEWHSYNKYCPRCGNRVKMEDGGYKQSCTNNKCSTNKHVVNVSYPRLDPVTIMLVISKDGQQCLLGRKQMFPKGMYSCLAGYMEPGETIEDAVRREVFEESGIQVTLVEYHSSQFWPYPTQLMIGCLAHATSQTIRVDEDELEDVKWFTRDNVRQACTMLRPNHTQPLWFPPKQAIARQLIEHWVEITSPRL